MTTTRFEGFEATVQKTNEWLRELRLDLDLLDQHRAYSVMRAVLHALRDRLTVEEATDLGAQLPMLVRGFYYEGWRPSSQHAKPLKDRHLEGFLEDVAQELPPTSGADAETAARAVFRLLDHRVTPGETSDVKSILPAEIRALWPSYVGAEA